jgi:hypothetical protein
MSDDNPTIASPAKVPAMCENHPGILISDHYGNKFDCPYCQIDTITGKLRRAIELATKDLVGSRFDRAIRYIETGEE